MRPLRSLAALLAVFFLLAPARAQEAGLGAETRYPTPEEAKLYCLSEIAGRWNGQIVTGVNPGGAAAQAGLRPGDLLIALDADPVYSRDDIEDFFGVVPPGAEVRVRVKRIDTFTVERLTLRNVRPTERTPGGLRWEFAGPGQLDAARARARQEGNNLLIGLSGAET